MPWFHIEKCPATTGRVRVFAHPPDKIWSFMAWSPQMAHMSLTPKPVSWLFTVESHEVWHTKVPEKDPFGRMSPPASRTPGRHTQTHPHLYVASIAPPPPPGVGRGGGGLQRRRDCGWVWRPQVPGSGARAHLPERALPQDRVPQFILPVHRDGGDWLMADEDQPSPDSQETLPTVVESPELLLSLP